MWSVVSNMNTHAVKFFKGRSNLKNNVIGKLFPRCYFYTWEDAIVKLTNSAERVLLLICT